MVHLLKYLEDQLLHDVGYKYVLKYGFGMMMMNQFLEYLQVFLCLANDGLQENDFPHGHNMFFGPLHGLTM